MGGDAGAGEVDEVVDMMGRSPVGCDIYLSGLCSLMP